MARKKSSSDAALLELRAYGLRFPEAHTKSPWPGHLDLAVKDKTFAYLSIEGQPFSISCKLPQSSAAALMLPFASPTGYGLGKSGWVSAQIPDGKAPPVDLFKAWIDESYRAQAPKRLAASVPPLEGSVTSAAPAGARRPTPRRAAKKRPAARAAKKAASGPGGAQKRAAKKKAAKKSAAKPRPLPKRPAKKPATGKAAAGKRGAS